MRKIFEIIIIMLLIMIFLLPIISGNKNMNVMDSIVVESDPESPYPPNITGPTEGKLNVRYSYEIKSEDPQCDNICYTVIFSDMPVIYNSKFCESGDVLLFNHSWDDFYQKEPPYFITAKATDCKGYESEWSNFEISITKIKFFNNIFFEQLLVKFQIFKFQQ